MSAAMWANDAGTVEERNGVFFLELTSGSETFTFVMPPRFIGVLGVRASGALKTFQSRQAEIIDFPSKGEGGSRPARKRGRR